MFKTKFLLLALLIPCLGCRGRASAHVASGPFVLHPHDHAIKGDFNTVWQEGAYQLFMQ